jgi:hypothetical protein
MAKKKSSFLRAIFDGPTNMDKTGIHGTPKYNVTVQRGHHGSEMTKPREHKGVSLFSLLRVRKARKSSVIDNR